MAGFTVVGGPIFRVDLAMYKHGMLKRHPHPPTPHCPTLAGPLLP